MHSPKTNFSAITSLAPDWVSIEWTIITQSQYLDCGNEKMRLLKTLKYESTALTIYR